MDSLLPSEIARLVLGYLEEECEVASRSLLQNCSYLQECYLMAQQGRAYSTKPYNKSLKQILEEYCAIRSLVSDRLKKLPESSASSLTQCSLVEQLSHLMGLSRSGQTLLVSITMPPQGGSSGGGAQASTTPPLLSQGRARSRQSSSAERYKRLSVRWQGGEAQQSSSQEVELVTSVEATPAKSLPGFSSGEDVESDCNLPTRTLENEKEGPISSHLDDSDIITPVGTGSCTSTPKRKTSCSKRKGTPSTKGSPQCVRGVTSSGRIRRSLSEEEPSESIDLTFLTQAFLENKELHQKIAENINRVIAAEQPSTSTEPRAEPSCSHGAPVGEIAQEMDGVIKTIVEKTEQDPLFERFLDDLIGPIDAAADGESEQGAEDREENLPHVVATTEAGHYDTLPTTKEFDVPLKQRLRGARHKKDTVETPVKQKERSGNKLLEEKTSKSSQQSMETTSETACPVSLEHQNAVAIESIVNANVLPPNKQSPPVLTFNTTLGHLVSSEVADTSQDHNTILSASCIDRLTKEVACLQNDKYIFLDANVSLPSFGGSFSLAPETPKTGDSAKCVTSQPTAHNSAEFLHKPLRGGGGGEVTDSLLSRNVQQTVACRFPVEVSTESTSTHVPSQQDTAVLSGEHNPLMDPGKLVGEKVVGSADSIFSATLPADSNKAVYSVVSLSSQPNTENVHGGFPLSFSSAANHATSCSGPKTVDSSTASLVSAGSQQSVCSVVNMMPQHIANSSSQRFLSDSATSCSKTCFSVSNANFLSGVNNETSDLVVGGAGEHTGTVCDTFGSFQHSGSRNVELTGSFLTEGGGTAVYTHISEATTSGASLQQDQMLSVSISEGDGSVVSQSCAGQILPVGGTGKEIVNLSHPLTESQLMQMPLILCGSERNVQLINILKPAPNPRAPIVPVNSRKKGYIPILPKKKERRIIGKKMIIVPSSTSLDQENIGQQLVMMPSTTEGDSLAMYSYSIAEEPVHYSDSNPCGQSLPSICLESPAAKDSEGREQLLGGLNLQDSDKKESASVSEPVISPTLLILKDVTKNNVSPTTAQPVAAIEADACASSDNVSHDTSTQEMLPRNTPTVSSGLRHKSANSRRLSLSTPRRKRSHIRTLDFNTPLKPTSVRKSHTSPKVSGKGPSPSKLSKSVRRMSLFKSPPNRVCTHSVTSENCDDLDASENNADIACPIATRSPAPTLCGSWDKVTGAGLIITENSPPRKRNGPAKTKVDCDKKYLETSSTVSPQRKKKPLNTWDSGLRALLSPSYTDPEPPSRISKLKKERKCSKKVTAEEVRRIESELCKSNEKETMDTSLVDSADTDEVEQPENGVPQISIERELSVNKREDVSQTQVKQDLNVSMQNKSTPLKGLKKRKSKQNSQFSCGLCCSESELPSKGEAKKQLKSNVKSPLAKNKSTLKNSIKTPLKINTKKLLKSNAKTSLKSNVKTQLKGKTKTPLKKTPFKSKVSMLIKSKNILQKQSSQKTKMKTSNRILKLCVEKLCVEKLDECHSVVLEHSVSNDDSLKPKDFDSAIVNTKSNHSVEKPCNTDDNVVVLKGLNIKPSDSSEAETITTNHINNTVVERNKLCGRKQRKNPTPSKNINKLVEKEKECIPDSETRIPVGLIATTESTMSKVVQSPTNLRAAKRTLVRNKLMAGRKLNLSEECSDVNSDMTETAPSCPQATVLDTPEKEDVSTNINLMVPMTPRIISPKIVEDTPITKLIKEQIATFEDTIMTPHFPCTPNIPVTPGSLETDLANGASPSSYPSRPTDYSSCSSYYQPSDDVNQPHKSLEQVLIDECCRMEANKATNESGKDAEQASSSKLSPAVIVTTAQPSECFSKEVNQEALEPNVSHGESTTESVQAIDQNEDTTRRKSVEKTTTIQEAKLVESLTLEDQSLSAKNNNMIYSKTEGTSEFPKQVEQRFEKLTVQEESDLVKSHKNRLVNQTKTRETLAEIEIASHTTELGCKSLQDKTVLIGQEEKGSVHQCPPSKDNLAEVEKNRDGYVDFVSEEGNSINFDCRYEHQTEDKSKTREKEQTAEVENRNMHEAMQKKLIEEKCEESLLAGDSASKKTNYLQQSCLQSSDKTKDVSGVDESCASGSDKYSKQTEEISSEHKETDSSCARTSVYSFKEKCQKDSEKSLLCQNLKSTKYDKQVVISSCSSDSSSSEESSSSDEENTNLVDSATKDSEKGKVKTLDSSNESQVLSNELFGNYSEESSGSELIDAKDKKQIEGDINSSKDALQQDTLKEKKLSETNTNVMMSPLNQDPVTKVVLGVVTENASSSDITHSKEPPDACQTLPSVDDKLRTELQEKLLRTIAKLREPPQRAKRRKSSGESLNIHCIENNKGSIPKRAAGKGKPDNKNDFLKETVTEKKINKLRKQGVNAIAERLRKQQQAVAHSVSKLENSQAESNNKETCAPTSDIEIQLSRMYCDLETNAGVQNADDTLKAKESSELSPVRNLEEILSNRVVGDKDINTGKRRFSNVDGHSTKIKSAGRTAAKFPKLSLRNSSVRSSKEQNMSEESSSKVSGHCKPNSSYLPINEINDVDNQAKCVSEKVSNKESDFADSSENILRANLTSETNKPSELGPAPSGSAVPLQELVDVRSTRERDDTNSASTKSSRIKGSKKSFSKKSNGKAMASPCKSGNIKVSLKTKNTLLTKTKPTVSISNEKDIKSSSSHNFPSRTKKNKNISDKVEKIKDVHKSSKEKVCKKTSSVLKENATVAHTSKEKCSSLDASDTSQYKELAVNCSSSKLNSLLETMSNTDNNKVSSLERTDNNTSQEHTKEKKQEAVLSKPLDSAKENSSRKQHDSEKFITEKETKLEPKNSMIRDLSPGKEICSDILFGTEENAGKENSCNDSVKELEIQDECRISSGQKQNSVIDHETYPGDSIVLVVENSKASEDVLVSEKNKSTKLLPAQDSVQVPLVLEQSSAERSLENEIAVTKEVKISTTEKLFFISYKSNGPHHDSEPCPFEWSDSAVKLVVDDFEVTCSVTPFVELLNLAPICDDESPPKEHDPSVENCKSQEDELIGRNKSHSEGNVSCQSDNQKVINKKELSRVPKLLNDHSSGNTKMISPLADAYDEGDIIEKYSNKNFRHSELDRLGSEKDEEKYKEKRNSTSHSRTYYKSSMDRHRSRLELRERAHPSTVSSRSVFYHRESSERQLFQDSGSCHERNTKPESSKNFDEFCDGRRRVKYSKHVYSSRSRSTERPHSYVKRREEALEDHDVRGRDSYRAKSEKHYVPELFYDDVNETPDSKYVRHKGKESYYFLNKSRGEVLEEKKHRGEVVEEREISYRKKKQHPSSDVDDSEERIKNRYYQYSSSSRNANMLSIHKKIRSVVHDKNLRINHPPKVTKPSSLEPRSKGSKEVTKTQHSRLEPETKVSTKISHDSLSGERNVENSYRSKLILASVRKQSEQNRVKVMSKKEFLSGEVSEQYHPAKSKRDISEDLNFRNEHDEYQSNSDAEQEMRHFTFENSPAKQMSDDDDDLMTYVTVGCPSTTPQIHSSEQNQRHGIALSELGVDKKLSSRERSASSSNFGNEDIRILPPKKRKASSEEMSSSHVEKKERLVSADPQTLLKKVGLENFLSVVHGDTQR
ncbi:uncharacterized protein LOC134528138 [Bacillus rossius redtenbacheri]|uniref:uncharacterized protein LOC134528138 n=1 Tax=Bacillus rossius redtenbacheri TaxID=93214 RepID=UPI002FDCBEE5